MTPMSMEAQIFTQGWDHAERGGSIEDAEKLPESMKKLWLDGYNKAKAKAKAKKKTTSESKWERKPLT